MQYTCHEQLIERVRQQGSSTPRVVAVVAAEDGHVLEAVMAAADAGLIVPRLYGDAPRIREIMKRLGRSAGEYEIIGTTTSEEAARKAGLAARDGEAHLLMKGLISTGAMLKTLFEAEVGFRTGALISHLAVVEAPAYPKLFGITDTGINVHPNLEQKAGIVRNAVAAFARMGFERPRVAVLSSSEDVNPKIPESVDARALQTMNEQGLISDCIVQGPLSFDLAVSPAAVAAKGLDCTANNAVAGDADLLLVPNVVAGNMLIKSLRYFGKARTAGMVVGGRVPISLSSRATSTADKLVQLALAAATTL